ncbi:MAG: AAA family ATPase, partial [Gemmatimonadota bacterium]
MEAAPGIYARESPYLERYVQVGYAQGKVLRVSFPTSPDDDASADFGEGIYGREWTERTYRACLREAERLLFQGFRVVVDGTFHAESRRRIFLETADRLSVPARFLHCRAGSDAVRSRLEEREGDVSD